MSLILDALRRADREREHERGGVPSLYAQAAPPWTAGEAGPARPRPWLWLAAGLGGGLLLAAVWALWSATPPGTAAATAPAAPVAQTEPATPTPDATRPTTPVPPPPLPQAQAQAPTQAEVSSPKPAAPTTIAEPARPTPRVPATAEAPAPVARPDRKPTPSTEPATAAPRPGATTPAAASPAKAASARDDTPASSPGTERPADNPIRQLGELPADVRRALPTLSFGGAMYSPKASSRRLIVNGQLLSEGEQVAPGVTLEEIRLKSAVLRWRDLRYEQGF